MIIITWQGHCDERIRDSYISSLPGMVIVCVAPCRSLKTGETAVVGEELILPLSDLGVRFPLTRTSQLPPPWTSVIQLPPVYLDRNDNKNYVYKNNTLTSTQWCNLSIIYSSIALYMQIGLWINLHMQWCAKSAKRSQPAQDTKHDDHHDKCSEVICTKIVGQKEKHAGAGASHWRSNEIYTIIAWCQLDEGYCLFRYLW